MHVYTKWMSVLLLGSLLGLGVLVGCAAATPDQAHPQEAATSAPTAVPTATSPGLTVTPVPATSTTAPTQTAAPTLTHTSVPTVVPTSTPMMPAAEPTCAPLPLDGQGETAHDGDPGVYSIIGLAGLDRLTMHSCPGTKNPVVGVLEPGTVGLRRAGQNQEVEGMPWTPVSTGEVAGWVQAGYLARQFGDADPEVAMRAGQVLLALRDQDWEVVAQAVHPVKGVRFSPYTYVRIGEGEDADRVFSAEELVGLAADTTAYHWGVFDGSGEPIDKTFADYYARFVYDADFGRAYAVGFNEIVGSGNTINNVAEVYPQAQVIEYHLPGSDPRFGGMDWRSLRLVLEQEGDIWYLVGIVHDEWTI